MYFGVNNGLFSTLGDVKDTVSDVVDLIKDVLDKTGSYCVQVLEAGLNIFSNFINFSLSLLTKSIDDKQFSGFWKVIDNVTSVLGVVASTLMVLLFLINLCTDAWENRHDLDMWDIMKMVMKMIVSVVLVNNAMLIVKGIFNMGSALAGIIFLTDTDTTLGLSVNSAVMLASGVNGFSGFLIFLVCLLTTLAIIVCGVTITMEIFQRVFKIYVLVPFSTITFTTFVMGNGNRGNEVFRSYLKTVIATAAEALIIMVCVNFSYSMIGNTDMMNGLMGIDTGDIEAVGITLTSVEDYDVLCGYLNNPYFDTYSDSDEFQTKYAEIAALLPADKEWATVMTYNPNTQTVNDISNSVGYDGVVSQIASNNYISELVKASSLSRRSVKKHIEESGSYTVYVCSKVDWKQALLICLTVLFPCILCSGAVKSAGQYASMIMGH